MGIVEEGAYTFVCIYDSTLDNKGNWTLTDTNSNEVIISNDTTLPGGTVADVVLSITGGNTLFNLTLSNIQRIWNGSTIQCSLRYTGGSIVTSTSATIEIYCKFPHEYVIVFMFVNIIVSVQFE